VVEGVHAAGGRIFVQLMHVCRIAHQNNLPSGARVLAPSAVASAGKM
jgi:N-ethylmaleimide reductase